MAQLLGLAREPNDSLLGCEAFLDVAQDQGEPPLSVQFVARQRRFGLKGTAIWQKSAEPAGDPLVSTGRVRLT